MTLPTPSPKAVHPKVAAAGAVGALVTVIVVVAGQLGYNVSADLAAALTTLLSFAAGYLKTS